MGEHFRRQCGTHEAIIVESITDVVAGVVVCVDDRPTVDLAPLARGRHGEWSWVCLRIVRRKETPITAIITDILNICFCISL